MASAPTITPNMPMGQAGETLRVRLRPDLVVRPQFYEGMTHYVVKDPIGLKYYRFKAEEYFLLQQLDGKSTLLEVKKAFERKYRPQTITVDDLVRFCSNVAGRRFGRRSGGLPPTSFTSRFRSSIRNAC